MYKIGEFYRLDSFNEVIRLDTQGEVDTCNACDPEGKNKCYGPEFEWYRLDEKE